MDNYLDAPLASILRVMGRKWGKVFLAMKTMTLEKSSIWLSENKKDGEVGDSSEDKHLWWKLLILFLINVS